uniref:Amino acid transporter n=1 Tax=Caenorhabditis japonica TaxID=281687 RepID=A0A8R1HWT9_CAEJA
MDASKSGKMGVLAVCYYMCTVIIASVIGVIVVLLIHPGNPEVKNINGEEMTTGTTEISALDSILDLIRNMFPKNIVEATMKRAQTTFGVVKKKHVFQNITEPQNMKKIVQLSEGTNILGRYVFTVMICLFLHCVVAIPLLFFFLTRKNPLFVAKGMIQPFATALGTASSGASLPQAIHCAEHNLHVDSRIAGFVMPLGNTINMDGNALYEAVAVIFIAQLNGIALSVPQIITICVTATFASIGLNAVPAGLVSMFVILSAVHLPISDISLLFTVDWLMYVFMSPVQAKINKFIMCKSDVSSTTRHDVLADLCAAEDGLEDVDRPAHLPIVKRVSFVDYHHIPSPTLSPVFNSTKTYSLKSAIITPLRAHVTLQTRLSHLSEE